MRRTRARKSTFDPQAESYIMYRRRCILLERQVARLLSSEPVKAAEAEIARLEQRCIDLEDRWEEAETDCYQLRQLVASSAA